ncbi:ATP-binding protein [Actinacidiphila acidipaludis]|uniref:ATP-binding protein n=1 Tax=Actinacidiphila acidipaludis TaxID=2873382 RepID=A0ABS7QBD2_9ACTN|nr:ATP-binding protein [Streptomyces acidipaludis]MBY8880448.1 ATP-binding protein [Streptomyces acidipaludis]
MNNEISTRTCTFVRLLPGSRAGAGTARRLTVGQLAAWGVPHDSASSEAAASVVAELAANAVTHGHVGGRDFELSLTLDPKTGVIRVEVSDPRGESRPPTAPAPPVDDAESGRGLLLVQALTRAWGVSSRDVGKTVWAEVPLPLLTVPAGNGPVADGPVRKGLRDDTLG